MRESEKELMLNERGTLLSRLVDGPSIFSAQIMKLQQLKEPIVLYGAGSLADDIYQTMTQHSIEIDAVCVDFPREDEFFHGYQILCLSDACDNYECFSVVIGFQDYELAESRLRSSKKISSIFKIIPLKLTSSIDKNFCRINAGKLEQFYRTVSDDLSRDSIAAYLNALISGKAEYLYSVYDSDQYFPHGIFMPPQKMGMVDCGAYTGDTLQDFVNRFSVLPTTYFAFEPVPKSFIELEATVSKLKLESAVLLQKGVSDSIGTSAYSIDEGEYSRISNSGSALIETDTIDNVCKDTPVTYIKMDIEGSELAALHGAKNTILRNKPVLAICIYHKAEDMLEIPEYILSLIPGYRLFVRQHCKVPANLVLYAI